MVVKPWQNHVYALERQVSGVVRLEKLQRLALLSLLRFIDRLRSRHGSDGLVGVGVLVSVVVRARVQVLRNSNYSLADECYYCWCSDLLNNYLKGLCSIRSIFFLLLFLQATKR